MVIFTLKRRWWLCWLLALPFWATAQVSEPIRLQIQALVSEKGSRTPAQKKIDSQLLYGLRMQRNEPITREVPALSLNLNQDANGKVKVNIRGVISAKLLSDFKSQGIEILSASERFGNIVANIRLADLETIASYGDVRFVESWEAPQHNDPRSDLLESKLKQESLLMNPKHKNAAVPNFGISLDFSNRAAVVRDKLSKALMPLPGGAISEADPTHKANLARSTFGVNGTGVKIGVLSDSYNNGGAAVANVLAGDLPGVGNPNGYTTPVTVLSDMVGGGSDEGRAMLQLIHDIAPGAQLYFATAFNSDTDFAQQILDLQAAGCQIIVDDVSYFNESPFQDGVIAQAVNTVTALGVSYFASAGNSGNKNDGTSGTWEGDYVEGSDAIFTISGTPFPGKLHSFGATEYNTAVAGGTSRGIDFFWSDPWGASFNDYDVFVVNSDGTTILRFSTNLQDGTPGQNPYERIGTLNVGERIYILKKATAAPRALYLSTRRGRLSISTSGVTRGHNACKTGYSVAATPAAATFTGAASGPFPSAFNATNAVETFSSDGPRRIFYNPDGSPITPGNLLFGTNGGELLQKPDITAADGTMTTVTNFMPFFGTSAAAPHAAAIAGLLKSRFPQLTSAQIRTALTSTAIDIEAPGTDRDSGAGIIMAFEALQQASNDLNCPTITVTNPSQSTAPVNQPLSVSFSQTGGTGVTYTSVDPLPTGLSLSASGVLSGTPNQIGTYSIVVVASQSDGCSGYTTYTLTVQGVVVKAGLTVQITAENGIPANNAPDPAETLTVNLPLSNLGNVSTTNLTATLLATGGVSNPSSPQSYGVVNSDGSMVSMPFTFDASGNCGEQITLTLALQDGSLNLGTISYVLWLGGVPGTPQTYANTTAMTIPSSGAASVYPSPIVVSGINGQPTKVTVKLNQINHTWPDDIDILLVGPAGQKFILMSDVGGGSDLVNVNLTFDDAAAAALPGNAQITSGTFRPTDFTNGGTETFASPAPAGPYLSPAPTGTATLTSAFVGQNPNGVWNLYVMDDEGGDEGSISGGWELTLQFAPLVCSIVPTLAAGNVTGSIGACFGSASALPNIQQFTVSGTNLTTSVTITPPAHFEISTSSGSSFGSTPIVLSPTGSTLATTTIYVRSAPSAPAGPISGQVTIASTGATTKQANVSGAIEALPIVSISPNPTAACLGKTVTLSATAGFSAYSWDKTGGTFSSTTQPAQINFVGSLATTYSFTVTVTATGTNSCTNAATRSLSVNAPPTAGINSATSVCAGATLNLVATGGSLYSWQASGGSFSSSSSSPTSWTATTPSNYSISLTIGDGTCTASTEKSITVTPNPLLTASSNAPVCAGSQLNLGVNGGTAWTWSGPSFSSNAQNPSRPSATAAMSGVYSVTVSTANGCTQVATTQVTINQLINPQLSSNSPLCVGSSIRLSVTGAGAGATYSWAASVPFSSSLQNPTRPNATTAMSGTYSVTVTGNCNSVTLTTSVVVSPNVAPSITALRVNNVLPNAQNNTVAVCINAAVTLNITATNAVEYSWRGPTGAGSGFTSSLVSPVNMPIATPRQGQYTVTVRNGCTVFNQRVINIQLINCGNTRIASAEDAEPLEMEINAYPNPVSKTLTVEVRLKEAQPLQLKLFNGVGQASGTWQLTEPSTVHKTELNLSALTGGVYLLEAQAGKQRAVKRVVKIQYE